MVICLKSYPLEKQIQPMVRIKRRMIDSIFYVGVRPFDDVTRQYEPVFTYVRVSCETQNEGNGKRTPKCANSLGLKRRNVKGAIET